MSGPIPWRTVITILLVVAAVVAVASATVAISRTPDSQLSDASA